MLIILKTVVIFLLTNFGNGFLFTQFFKNKSSSFVFTSLIGMCGLMLLQTAIAFFCPLNGYVEILFLLSGVFGLLMFIRTRNFSSVTVFTRLNIWFYIYFVIILLAGSFLPYWYDHYSYYVPTINYLREFGFVKGVASLDLLLGQSSFWHIYQSTFSHFTDPDLKVNTYLAVLFLFYIYERRQWVFLVFLALFLPFLQQPSPDFPVLVITLIIINELIGKRDSQILMCLSLLAVCIKPTSFWLVLLLIGLRIYKKNWSVKMLLPVFIFGSVYMLKNFWLFGFPVFPAALIDFNLPWQPSREILTYSSQIGLLKSYDMQYSWQQVMAFDFWERICHWFDVGYKAIFNWGILGCLFVLGFFAILKKSMFYRILFFVFVLKFFIIITISAQYRFFADLYLVTLFVLLKAIPRKENNMLALGLSAIVLVFFSFPGLLKGQFSVERWLKGFDGSQIYKPQQLDSVAINSEYTIGNLSFYVPKDPMQKSIFPSLSIYDLQIYQYYGVFPQRGGNGFVQRKLSVQEKKQLDGIIRIHEISRP
ncbi:hypothetical protein HER18_10795 [Chryseobacterium sp. NEB161]|nr:hypothetical protein HER18_10795 [Chryseobacterium sp. NEB161]